jgi:hypothetical protein
VRACVCSVREGRGLDRAHVTIRENLLVLTWTSLPRQSPDEHFPRKEKMRLSGLRIASRSLSSISSTSASDPSLKQIIERRLRAETSAKSRAPKQTWHSFNFLFFFPFTPAHWPCAQLPLLRARRHHASTSHPSPEFI